MKPALRNFSLVIAFSVLLIPAIALLSYDLLYEVDSSKERLTKIVFLIVFILWLFGIVKFWWKMRHIDFSNLNSTFECVITEMEIKRDHDGYKTYFVVVRPQDLPLYRLKAREVNKLFKIAYEDKLSLIDYQDHVPLFISQKDFQTKQVGDKILVHFGRVGKNMYSFPQE